MIDMLGMETFKHLKNMPYSYELNGDKYLFGLFVTYNGSISIKYCAYIVKSVCLTASAGEEKKLNEGRNDVFKCLTHV